MISSPPATVTVGSVTGIRLLVRSTAGVTPPMDGQPTSVGSSGTAVPSGISLPSSVVGNADRMSASAASNVVTTTMSDAPTAAVSQPVASGEISDPGLANIKEKTPMCLVNELARFNKITHQYKLVDETGPAHKKTFSVVLKLGDEEYAASGPSIKKAQHAAAENALRDTKYKHPISRNRNGAHQFLSSSPTPTVELNALAMKRGESVVYSTLEHPVPNAMALGPHPPPPPHHLHHPHQFGPGLSSTYNNANSHFPSSSPHPHHHRYPVPPPPPPIGRNFIPPPMPPYPRGGSGGGVNVPSGFNPHPHHPHHHPQSAFDFRGMCNQRYHRPLPHHLFPPPHRPANLCYVSLKVGTREFIGQGISRQLARHQAATKAILCLSQLPEVSSASLESSKDDTLQTALPSSHQQLQQQQQQPDVLSVNPDGSETPSTTHLSDDSTITPASVIFTRESSMTWSNPPLDATGPIGPIGGPTGQLSGPIGPFAAPTASNGDPIGPFGGPAGAIGLSDVSFIDPVLRSMQELTMEDDVNDGVSAESGIGDLKSEISLVHEITLKRNLSVDFQVINESGPPHMRVYVTQCVVSGSAAPEPFAVNNSNGSASDNLLLKTEAEGNGKKVSKKKAAESMLKLLRALPSVPQYSSFEEPFMLRKGKMATKKKRQNLIKVQKGDTDYGQGINPISRLIQIQQAKREKEPAFALLTERGLPRRREFVMQVTVNENQCTGTGPNKKLAKRAAAEVMLQTMGYSKPSPQPDKPAIRTPGTTPTAETANKKVTFTLSEAAAERGMIDGAGQLYRKSRRGGTATLQQLPGVIFMPEGSASAAGIFNSSPVNENKHDSDEVKLNTEGGMKSLRLHIPAPEITSRVGGNVFSHTTKQAADSTSDAPVDISIGKFPSSNISDPPVECKPFSQMSMSAALPVTGHSSFAASPATGHSSFAASTVTGQPSFAASPVTGHCSAYAAPALTVQSAYTSGVVNSQHVPQAVPGGYTPNAACHSSSGPVTGHNTSGPVTGHSSSANVAILSRTASNPATDPASPPPGSVRPKQQLIYLAEVLGFHVNFTDFPKKGHGQEYLSLVSLTTNPPQVSHGSGLTLEASQNAASLHALKCLAELGLESVSGGGAIGNNHGNSLGNNLDYGTESPIPGTNAATLQSPSNSFTNCSSFPLVENAISGSMHSQLGHNHNCHNGDVANHHHPSYQQLDSSMTVVHTTSSSAQRLQHHLHAS